METVTVTDTVTVNDTSINNTSIYSIADKMKVKPNQTEINQLDNLVK
jgi:hypothetical protein